ncbi:hypothetical protein AKJ51_02000 [candidate division MSBL1 archaeon SCGC-AAA382A20]|uniref:Uncharacterized protein n=1 Tax=candidate division MSBL1 archaeon SCGC-AAA382A20 TaxID=1698280 RepID=A0A133VL03_9EURY|nr:hypothetical protein AKJ51_02000 [candidate division MSBL1 archaeon SCGC-AAA382A20]
MIREKMVSTGKIFRISKDTNLGFIARKLKDFREEEPYESLDYKGNLIRETYELKTENGTLYGTYSKDTVITIYHRDGEIEVPKTKETRLVFTEKKREIFLAILAEKPKANRIANELSEAIFLTPGEIVEAKIREETLKELHESNPRATKVIYFDNVDLPDVGKLALYGSSLADTSLYQEYLDHGNIWYAVFEVKEKGIVVGVTRNSVVVLFSKLEEDEFIEFILEDILPLVSLEE